MAYERFQTDDNIDEDFLTSGQARELLHAHPKHLQNIFMALQLLQLNAPADQEYVELGGVRIRCEHIRSVTDSASHKIYRPLIHHAAIEALTASDIENMNEDAETKNDASKRIWVCEGWKGFGTATGDKLTRPSLALTPLMRAYFNRSTSDTVLTVHDIAVPVDGLRFTIAENRPQPTMLYQTTKEVREAVQAIYKIEESQQKTTSNAFATTKMQLTPFTGHYAIANQFAPRLDDKKVFALLEALQVACKKYPVSRNGKLETTGSLQVPFSYNNSPARTLVVPSEFVCLDGSRFAFTMGAKKAIGEFFGSAVREAIPLLKEARLHGKSAAKGHTNLGM